MLKPVPRWWYQVESKDGVDAVTAEIKNRGGNALAVTCNVSEASAIQKLIDTTLAAYGSIDILVNNAAANPSFGPVVVKHPNRHSTKL